VSALCKRPSQRVHGYYARTLCDLPWCATPVRYTPVRLRVRVRKFFCDQPSCERTIFAERLDEVARVHARGTDRQREALEWIAFALGGEAGARLAHELGLLVSPDTLLNRMRGAHRAEPEDVRVLGVDDFGFRKGNASATILVDLQRHRIVDLFEGHSAGSIAQWLRQRPGVEVVSRERSPVCREGVNDGAPQARHVAERWHLLHNLTQVLEEFLLRKRPALRDALPEPQTEEKREDVGVPNPARTVRPGSWQASKEEAADVRFISGKLGISPRTVSATRISKSLHLATRQTYTTRASVLDPYVPYLLGRAGALERRLSQRQAAPPGDPPERLLQQREDVLIRFTGELRRAEAGPANRRLPHRGPGLRAPWRGYLPRPRTSPPCSCLERRSSARSRGSTWG
jgi:Transposase